MKKSRFLNAIIGAMCIDAFAAVTVATQQGATNGGTLFSDGTRTVYSKEIEF
jgi:hypothetical protein